MMCFNGFRSGRSLKRASMSSGLSVLMKVCPVMFWFVKFRFGQCQGVGLFRVDSLISERVVASVLSLSILVRSIVCLVLWKIILVWLWMNSLIDEGQFSCRMKVFHGGVMPVMKGVFCANVSFDLLWSVWVVGYDSNSPRGLGV